jgi:2-polyprenyl-3-methyl-5-hydroxy-6-metoxy-1,4-benzoquinol methylase
MIINIPYPRSKRLEREIEFIHNSLSDTSDIFFNYPTAESYFENFMSKPDGIEMDRHIKALGSRLRVLDVGAGIGHSSIYLAAKGHNVSVVEPSPDASKVIDLAAAKYGLKITV